MPDQFDLAGFRKAANDSVRNGDGCGTCDCGELMREAADEIERLREDCACYEAMKNGVAMRIADLEAEIERLRAALEPFSVLLARCSPDDSPDQHYRFDLRHGDILEAAQAAGGK